MFYSTKYNGWVYPAENRQVSRVLREKWFAPYVWTFCPFCSGALPDADSPIERLLKPPDYGGGPE